MSIERWHSHSKGPRRVEEETVVYRLGVDYRSGGSDRFGSWDDPAEPLRIVSDPDAVAAFGAIARVYVVRVVERTSYIEEEVRHPDEDAGRVSLDALARVVPVADGHTDAEF
jgi:hypothetical protein